MSTSQPMSRGEVLEQLIPGARVTRTTRTEVGSGTNFWAIMDNNANSVAVTASDRLNQAKASPFIGSIETLVYSRPQLMRRLLEPLLGKCQNVLLPLTLVFPGRSAHANLIILHRVAERVYDIERWDPWQVEGSHPVLDRDLKRFFEIVFLHTGFYSFFIETRYTCPVTEIGIQSLVRTLGDDVPACRQLMALSPGGLCTLWTFVYAVLRLYRGNAKRDSFEIDEYLQEWAVRDLPGLCLFASSVAATLIRRA